MNFFKTFILCVFGILFFTFANADFTSTSFILENPINFIEGGQSTSSNFQYISTTGQTAQGQSTSLNFAQNAGFLYFPDVSTTPVDVGGGGGIGRQGLILDYCRIADFNCDEHVNIFDLSILLYYVDQPSSIIDPYDLSKDDKVDFVDTSIVFYYWDTDV